MPDRTDTSDLFQLAVEASPCGMIMIDGEGRIVLLNAEAERLFGYARSELIGQPLDRLVPERYRSAHPANRKRFTLKPERRPMGMDRELFGLRKDGSEIPVEIALNPLRTPNGPMVLASIVDITERKSAAERVERYAEMLERSNEELQHFAYIVSHDLKAPLRGVATVAEWLAEDFGPVVDDDARQAIALMLERVDRLTRMIDDVLLYSRAGEAAAKTVEIDAHELVADVIASLPVPPGVAVAIEGSLPRLRYGETQLRQVFQNLIVNAIQHMGTPDGAIVVACRRDGGCWRFTVRDSGVGVAAEHRDQIFKLFETVRSKERSWKTGVGLPIAKRIVERNGGTIGVSAVEPGCELFFTVPIAALETLPP